MDRRHQLEVKSSRPRGNHLGIALEAIAFGEWLANILDAAAADQFPMRSHTLPFVCDWRAK
jgi:hypothetical protein